MTINHLKSPHFFKMVEHFENLAMKKAESEYNIYHNNLNGAEIKLRTK